MRLKKVNLSSLLIIDYEDKPFFLSYTLLPFPSLVSKALYAQIGREKHPRRLAYSSPLSVHRGCILVDLGMCAAGFFFLTIAASLMLTLVNKSIFYHLGISPQTVISWDNRL